VLGAVRQVLFWEPTELLYVRMQMQMMMMISLLLVIYERGGVGSKQDRSAILASMSQVGGRIKLGKVLLNNYTEKSTSHSVVRESRT